MSKEQKCVAYKFAASCVYVAVVTPPSCSLAPHPPWTSNCHKVATSLAHAPPPDDDVMQLTPCCHPLIRHPVCLRSAHPDTPHLNLKPHRLAHSTMSASAIVRHPPSLYQHRRHRQHDEGDATRRRHGNSTMRSPLHRQRHNEYRCPRKRHCLLPSYPFECESRSLVGPSLIPTMSVRVLPLPLIAVVSIRASAGTPVMFPHVVVVDNHHFRP